ncbi:hypothetical protein BD410DRAFT_310247 [Rickenella mellea]|uniref:Uncharacterized protein n=1 Tax=Rickenella mellea TaxID=50990 RepID=A0A4Y7Q1Q5_9AGAM|nr:hypothetical protein BD410DRAFT_310247 [Rickenella mellea]
MIARMKDKRDGLSQNVFACHTPRVPLSPSQVDICTEQFRKITGNFQQISGPSGLSALNFNTMWCTRWFLPLIILPLPTAPPFFLIVLLISLTLHARPCFYCMVLLSALFASSCYWQPLPLSAKLAYPISNITTYSEALLFNFTSGSALAGHGAGVNATDAKGAAENGTGTTAMKLPHTIQLYDRCWCGIGPAGIFAPFDVERWEHASIARARRALAPPSHPDSNTTSDAPNPSSSASTDSSVSDATPPPTSVAEEKKTPLFPLAHYIRNVLWPAPRLSSPSPAPIFSPSLAQPSTPPPSPTSTSTPSSPEESPPSQSLNPHPLPRFRREYDLRPYGVGVILDFGWGRGSRKSGSTH